MKPLFIFSLPRSGSTLLQKVLMSHPEIKSIAEPWILIPFCYALKKNGILAEYNHETFSIAFHDYINALPNKVDDYYSAINGFINELYKKQASGNEKYFLDKTPRYYTIIPEISKIFPEGKFIFLFRNPVQILSSIIQTWGKGELKNLYNNDIDLKYGFTLLIRGYELLKDRSFSLNYENFVNNPKHYLMLISKYLEIDYDEKMLIDFSKQHFKGRKGDQGDLSESQIIEKVSVERWRMTFNNIYRKRYLRKFIRDIDENILKRMGYNKQKILNEINSLETSNNRFLCDFLWKTYSDLIIKYKLNIFFRNNTKKWVKDKYLS